MAEKPIKDLYYVSVVGLPGEVRIFCREVSKLPEWALHEREGTLFVAKHDAGADDAPRAAEARTERLIKRVSRAFLLGVHKQPLDSLKCGGQLRVTKDCKKEQRLILGTANIVLPAIKTQAVGTVSGPNAPAAARDLTKERIDALNALEGDDAIETMFNLFETEGGRLGTLFNILERIVAVLGSEIPSDWISKTDLKRLRGTANHDKAGGLTARHHQPSWEPPADPMPLEEARDHVRRILDRLIHLRAACGRK